jgi:hypothetical protein
MLCLRHGIHASISEQRLVGLQQMHFVHGDVRDFDGKPGFMLVDFD